MFQTLLEEFSAAWNVFIRIPLPAFLSGAGERSEYAEIDGHPALLRIMMPLIGLLLGWFAAAALWILHLLPSGRLAAGFAGAVLIPLFLEFAGSWKGLTALSEFLDWRRRGASLEEALSVSPGSINEPRSGVFMLLMMSVYLIRILFCGVLAFFAPFWFMIALTGAWLVRAELASLNPAGISGQSWLRTPRGFDRRHWYVALGAMILAGILHPLGALLAFTVSWAVAWLAKNLCLDSISGISRPAFEVFGYSAELVLMFLGILLYAAV